MDEINFGMKTDLSIDGKINLEKMDSKSAISNLKDIEDPFLGINEGTVMKWESILYKDRSSKIKFVKDDCELLNEQLDMYNQRVIKNDCDRTRVKDKDILPSFREYLESILTFYCKKNDIKYKQGMNEVVAPFLLMKGKLQVSLSKVFNLFASFVEKFLTNYYYEDEFFSLQSSLALMNLLLKYHDPEIFNVFEFALITPEMYATSWVLTIFAKYKSF